MLKIKNFISFFVCSRSVLKEIERSWFFFFSFFNIFELKNKFNNIFIINIKELCYENVLLNFVNIVLF